MDIQQAINIEIFRRFEEESIEFAYPTRTIHVKQEPAFAHEGESIAGGNKP
jgi:small-conductance mechanosensitive channel